VKEESLQMIEVHLANWFFDGARADVAKVVSANPAFQLTHAFALGSATKPASYNFGAIFANAQVCRFCGKKM
jgi:mitochondrial import receptor subunit TOM40